MFLAAVNSVHAASARVVSVEPLLQKAFRLRCRLRIHNAGAQNNAGAKVQVPASPATVCQWDVLLLLPGLPL